MVAAQQVFVIRFAAVPGGWLLQRKADICQTADVLPFSARPLLRY
jgi:hypothetical protein